MSVAVESVAILTLAANLRAFSPRVKPYPHRLLRNLHRVGVPFREMHNHRARVFFPPEVIEHGRERRPERIAHRLAHRAPAINAPHTTISSAASPLDPTSTPSQNGVKSQILPTSIAKTGTTPVRRTDTQL